MPHPRLRRALGAALAGLALIPLGARIELPMVPVPMSLQTLAVLVLGGVLGPVLGALAVGAYLFAGGLGLPVFAGGASGWGHLVGATGGYLAGFLVAAVQVGALCRAARPLGRFRGLVAMLVGHAWILGLGWLWLAREIGAGTAFEQGVAPFWLGALVKSLVAVAIVRALAHRRTRAARGQPSVPSGTNPRRVRHGASESPYPSASARGPRSRSASEARLESGPPDRSTGSTG